MGLLDSILGGLAGGAAGGMRPRGGGGLQAQLLQALIPLLIQRTMQGRMGGMGGMGGGLGGVLGGVLGGGRMPAGAGAARGGGMGGLGTLGGLGALAGLAILANKLKQGGLNDAVGSWIGTGPNQQVSPHQLQGALGPDVIDELAGQFGLPPEQVSNELAGAVPQALDELTPEGHWPDMESVPGGQQVPGMEDIGELLRRFDAR